MTRVELEYWCSRAERGESFIYAVGSERLPPNAEAMKTARILNRKGLVALTTRRSSSQTSYIAQRTWKKEERG